MQFRLARELHMTVGELGQRMSAREFLEWAIFLEMEHDEQERSRQQGAVLTPRTPEEEVEAFKVITNAGRSKGQN